MGEAPETIPLGELVALQRGTTYKSALLGMPGPVLLGLGSIERNGGFRSDSLKTYGGDSPDKLILQPGDLYVSLKDVTQVGDLLGAVSQVPKTVPLGRLTQDTVKLIFKSGRVSSDYVYWLLRTPGYRDYCRARGIGTTNLSLSREDFLAFPVPIPWPRQQTLVETLSALDDRSELNQRSGETLEATAHALFANRFVNDRLESSIEDVAFGHVAEIVREVIGPQASPEALFDHYSLPAFDRGREPVRELGASIKSVKMLVPSGSVLLSKLNPTIDRVWLTDTSPDAVSICSTEFLVLKPRPPVGRAFLYCLARSDAFRQSLIALATGTSNSHQRVQSSSLLKIPIPLPNASEADRFELIAGPMLLRSVAARREARSLREIRDALLPRLLSGASSSDPGRARGVVDPA